MTEKIWAVAPDNPEARQAIADAMGLEPLLCRLLTNRGALTPSAADAFLNPGLASISDPFQMPEMEKAAERIALARERGEKVAVYGDYDVDGLTAAASLRKFLVECGICAFAMVPERDSGKRGLKPEEAEKIRRDGTALLVTADSGAASLDAARRAGELGLDLIITDHHEPSDVKPPAHAVVNTHYCQAGLPNADLSGAGVAFKLMMAVRRKIFSGPQQGNPPNLKRLLSMVAMGTVADCVPLTGDNRILARHGLEELSSKNLYPGLAALKSACKLNGRAVSARDISFDLAPRLASASRMNSARTALELLGAMDAVVAAGLASTLEAMNAQRKKIQERVWTEARSMAQQLPPEERRTALVLMGDGWEPGVIGIVASRLVEEYHAPAVVVSFSGDEAGKGSCRSIHGFDLHSLLEQTAGVTEGFGGHAGAAGLYISREKFGLFKEMFLSLAKERLGLARLLPKIYVDMELDPSLATLDMARRLALIEPCGEGNPPPSFAWRNVRLSAPPDFIGEDEQTVRLSFKVENRPVKAIAFKMAGFFQGLDWKRTPLDIVYAPEINFWADSERLRIRILDLRKSREE